MNTRGDSWFLFVSELRRSSLPWSLSCSIQYNIFYSQNTPESWERMFFCLLRDSYIFPPGIHKTPYYPTGFILTMLWFKPKNIIYRGKKKRKKKECRFTFYFGIVSMNIYITFVTPVF